MDGGRRGKKVGTPSSLVWWIMLGPFQRFANRFAEANLEQQLWMSGLCIEHTAYPGVERDTDSDGERRQ